MNKVGLFSFYHVPGLEYTLYTLETLIYNAQVRRILLLYRRSGNKAYTWDVMSGHTSIGVCLERMHRAFSELLVLAERYNPVETGPRKVSILLHQLSREVPLSADMHRILVLFKRGQRDALSLLSSHKRQFCHISISEMCILCYVILVRCVRCCFVGCNRFRPNPECCACFWMRKSFQAASSGWCTISSRQASTISFAVFPSF